MSEENIENAESETPEISPAENFVNAVTAKDFVSASKEFEEMMLSKVDVSLEQEKINLASQVFNGNEAEDDDNDGLPSDVEPEQVEDETEQVEDENDAEEEDFDDEEDSDEEEDESEEDESEEDWDEEESNKRMDVIGQNGNDGLHYDDINDTPEK